MPDNIETTTTTEVRPPSPPRSDTILYPGFRDANPNSVQSALNNQNSMAAAEVARQNAQGTRHGTGWSAVPLPEKIEYPTITGDNKVIQKNIATEFSEKVSKLTNFSKWITGTDRKHWDALDKLQGKDTKLNYMKKNNLSGGIWDAAKWSFENSGLPNASKARSNQLRESKELGRKENR